MSIHRSAASCSRRLTSVTAGLAVMIARLVFRSGGARLVPSKTCHVRPNSLDGKS